MSGQLERSEIVQECFGPCYCFGFLLCFVFETRLVQVILEISSCDGEWPWTSDSPASLSSMAGFTGIVHNTQFMRPYVLNLRLCTLFPPLVWVISYCHLQATWLQSHKCWQIDPKRGFTGPGAELLAWPSLRPFVPFCLQFAFFLKAPQITDRAHKACVQCFLSSLCKEITV